MRTFKARITAGIAIAALCVSGPALAWKAGKIDSEANEAIKVFNEKVEGGSNVLNKAAGYLIFPKVYKAGIGIGGETGTGVLRVGGSPVNYYRTTAASIGFQLGAQAKSIIVAFMTQEALDKFQNSSGWEVGVDGSVALVDIGAGGSIDTTKLSSPVIGFVYGAKGLMYNLTLEGSKFSKLNPDKRED